jgi:Ca2+-transporting ATPase
MRVTVAEETGPISYFKGAPEVLLSKSRLSVDERRNWADKADAYAVEGSRVLALAWGAGAGDDELTFLGLVMLWDPPRAEVPEAIRLARAAGIRVVMVTGDHPATALAVANEVGISTGRVLTGLDLETLSAAELLHAVREVNIFARVAPQDKLRLVEALKANGESVAVTGDGVNDAPALKRSDVGVAMGRRGAAVAREVADLVLLDDNFASIVAAIEEGRNIYENIQKFIRFLFAANLALVLIVVVGALGSFLLGLRDAQGGLLLPLTAIQLLWLNVITNGPPALALGLDKNFALMRRRPRPPAAPLFDPASLRFVLFAGITSAFVGGLLLIVLPRQGYSLTATRAVVFSYSVVAQLICAYPARRIVNAPRFNIALHLAVAFGIGLQLLAIFWPTLRTLLGVERTSLFAFLWVTMAVLLSWGAAEAYSRLVALRWRTSIEGTEGAESDD